MMLHLTVCLVGPACREEEKHMLQRFAILLSAAGLVMTVACAETDPGITTAVKTKLAADDTVKAYQIDVDTANGVVTLTGVVENPAAKELAVTLARGTDGVTEVVDRITVNAANATNPGNLSDDARDTADSAGDRIQDGAEATKDAAERGLDATKDAAGRAGDRIGEAASTTGEVVTDAAITAAVKSKVLADTTTPGLKIDVDTQDGVVTLNGTVRTRAEADRAMSLARETNGVKRVVNNLKIAA
jgi:hyperosmotically inducible protein